MTDFVYMRACKKSKIEQMRVYTTLRRYREQPESVRDHIHALCQEVAGEYGPLVPQGLFRFLTTAAGVRATCEAYGISEWLLAKMRRDVYDRFQL